MEGAAEVLDREAEALTQKLFEHYQVSIKGLRDERQQVYDEIKGMSHEPQRIQPKRRRVRTEETKELEGNMLETRRLHLMADEKGEFPVASLNDWETSVLDAEMQRDDFLAWYRNPSRPSDDALAVARKDGNGNWRRLCPDLVFSWR